MRLSPSHLLLAVLTCLTAGCAAHRQNTFIMSGAACTSAGGRLSELWKALHDAVETPGGCDLEGGRRCEALQTEIARLALNCPNHTEVLMANALLAYQAHDLIRSQQLLDQLLTLPGSYPEAASLRARVALQEGNLRFALRFLEDQLHLAGDDSGLHETYASALYLARRWDEARSQLGIAGRLGAPAWRVAYGLGLIEEGQGHFPEAKARYEEARQSRPEWKQPEARLRALVAAGKVAQ
jgi:tetratricopeptide (TPR) repeat protein